LLHQLVLTTNKLKGQANSSGLLLQLFRWQNLLELILPRESKSRLFLYWKILWNYFFCLRVTLTNYKSQWGTAKSLCKGSVHFHDSLDSYQVRLAIYSMTMLNTIQ